MADDKTRWSVTAHRARPLPRPRMPALRPYACDPRVSRGRVHGGPASPTRSEFQRDRDRILHSSAFRRLKHKTQVFIFHEGDHYRTRLTHSLEVAQVARSIARALWLDEDLAEAIALAHDLGHPPFGHAGEDALDEVMAPHGGFDHNAQSLRIVTLLEDRYARFDGLDLTWETLEGLVKHNGPVETPFPYAFLDYPQFAGLEPSSYASLEAQAAAVADDVAYNAHDVDDGLRSRAFPVEALRAVPFVAAIMDEIADTYGPLEPRRTRHEIVRRLITYQIEDVLAGAYAALAEGRYDSPRSVRDAGGPIIVFSPAMAQGVLDLKAFLFEHLYRHADRIAERHDATHKLVTIFRHLLDRPGRLPDKWRRRPTDDPPRQICDYIAGMTDGYAFKAYDALTG